MSEIYRARWSRLLKSISLGGSAVLLGVAFLAARAGGTLPLLLAGGLLLLLLGSLLFTVRGYEIAGGQLLVTRLLWTTRLSLDGLRSVETDPESLRRSLRLFGNGGLFSFTGLFRSKALGTYRAFVTEPRNAVILRWADRRVVISPDRPEAFARELRERRGLGG